MNRHSQLNQVSIIIPTYNEYENIGYLLDSLEHNMPGDIKKEAIVIDDNSPDGTANLVEQYIKRARYSISLIKRKAKDGLSSAILSGITHARGNLIVVLDGDLSHPTSIIPKMIDVLKKESCDIVIASRYTKGGSISGWTLKRKLVSRMATLIAKKGLGLKESDPISGFFAFRKAIIKEINFDAIGYKFLLEMLVKTRGAVVKEIPYTFTDRTQGKSKLGAAAILDYMKSVWKLYRYGKSVQKREKRTSVRFLSKAARFFTVGASGVGVNYLVSLLLVVGNVDLWYLHANIVGIAASMTSNFVLNKVWTFEDNDFSPVTTLAQYGKFVLISSLGALIQLGMVYYLVEEYNMLYPLALLSAVAVAAFGNFVLNKRLTFKEKVWS